MPGPTSSRDALRRQAAAAAESLRQAGVTHLPKPQAPSCTSAAAGDTPQRVAGPGLNPPDTEPPAGGDKLVALRLLREEVAGCTRCKELAQSRTQTVFSAGTPHARLCFVGEAPGADEDAQGEPFVGRAGQLLNRIIEACGLKRDEVYICNVLKCRPPDNRTPSPDEVINCLGFLERQLELVRPEYICCLGAVAARALLDTNVPMGRLRGRFHRWRDIPVLCTYHPAYLLRNPSAKRDVWEDMQLLMRTMGIEIPARS